MKAGYVSKGAKGAPAHLENPNVVIDIEYPDIEYPEDGYLPLPIDFFRKDSKGKTYCSHYFQPARSAVS